MAVKKAGDKWEVRKAWKYTGGTYRRLHTTEKEAKDVLAMILGASARGRDAERELRNQLELGGDLTLQTFWEKKYGPECETRQRSYRRTALSARHVLAVLGNRPLQDFQPAWMYEYVARRSKAESERDKGRTIHPQTINREIAFSKALFSFAVRSGVIQHNPLTRFPLLRWQKKEMWMPSVAQYQGWLASLSDPYLQAIVAVAGETGMRRSEICQLRWADLDLRGRQITVGAQTKSYKPRRIPMSGFLAEKLAALVRRVDRAEVFPSWQEGDHVGKVLARQGIKLHSLRHMRATLWLETGVPIHFVQAWLGHSSITVTAQYLRYVHDSATEAFQRAEAIERQRLNDSHAAVTA